MYSVALFLSAVAFALCAYITNKLKIPFISLSYIHRAWHDKKENQPVKDLPIVVTGLLALFVLGSLPNNLFNSSLVCSSASSRDLRHVVIIRNARRHTGGRCDLL